MIGKTKSQLNPNGDHIFLRPLVAAPVRSVLRQRFLLEGVTGKSYSFPLYSTPSIGELERSGICWISLNEFSWSEVSDFGSEWSSVSTSPVSFDSGAFSTTHLVLLTSSKVEALFKDGGGLVCRCGLWADWLASSLVFSVSTGMISGPSRISMKGILVETSPPTPLTTSRTLT